jgi:hypothetical protein
MKLARGHGFFTTLPEIVQHLAFRAKKPSEEDQALDATHSFIAPYSFSCIALRR